MVISAHVWPVCQTSVPLLMKAGLSQYWDAAYASVVTCTWQDMQTAASPHTPCSPKRRAMQHSAWRKHLRQSARLGSCLPLDSTTLEIKVTDLQPAQWQDTVAHANFALI